MPMPHLGGTSLIRACGVTSTNRLSDSFVQLGFVTMKILIAVALAATTLSACTSTEKTATGGALLGAGTGAILNGGRGAVAGALIGGVAGTLIGKAQDVRCVYRDERTGRTYRRSC